MTERHEIIEKLHALADDELSASERTEIHAVLQSDEGLKVQYTAIMDLKLAVSQLPREAQPELLNTVRKRLAEIDRVSRADHFVGRYAWVLSGLVLVSIIGGGVYSRMHGSGRVGITDVQNYSASLVGSPLSGAAHGVENWIKGELGSTPNPQVHIVREEFGVLGGAPAARILLADPNSPGTPYTLFVIESKSEIGGMEADPSNKRFQEGKLGMYNCVNWGQGKYQMLLVGSQPVGTLESVANSLNIR